MRVSQLPNYRKKGGIHIKRPLVWVFFLFGLLLISLHFIDNTEDSKLYSIPEDTITVSNAKICVSATFDHLEQKSNSVYLYLSDCSFHFCRQKYSFSNFLAVVSTEDFTRLKTLFAGNKIQIIGNLSSFQTPTNPGQFNEKAYYKEKNIFYKIYGKKINIISSEKNYPKAILYQYKDKLCHVMEQSLSQKHSGIIKAMLLGEKSTLDLEIKKLYQISGIGHLLAISGLHITILCSVLYRILTKTNLPQILQFLFTIALLVCYGIMTNFSISTSRAVIMMCMFLLAPVIHRTYDGISAMAFSALIILLQKPYALFSCSFLLSYSAVFGIYYVQPHLRTMILGNITQREKNNRKRKRLLSEAKEKVWKYYLLRVYYILHEKLFSTLLGSISISISTLPIMLYFFFEIPTYSMLLNLLVLPLSSGLILFSALGAVLGSIWFPLGKIPFSIVTIILNLYERASRFFFELPQPIQVFGHPKLWQIVIYYLAILIVSFFVKKMENNETGTFFHFLHSKKTDNLLCGILFILGLFCLLTPKMPKQLECHMLDVGQGDGILLRNKDRQSILIDGGSTNVSGVGTYRIIPYLKYYGIRRLDMMIITHADEDHISGQLELLSSIKENGIAIRKILIPEPSEERKNDENYQLFLNTARKAKIPTEYIHKGDSFFFGDAMIQCIHPQKGFKTDSANAYSTTLLVRLGTHRLLFTGDLEEEGEEDVLKWLICNDIKDITLLKVAHHGSGKSTSKEFLEQIKPQVALISCGKNNSYGHPHVELLKRLEATKTQVFRTDHSGAIRFSVNNQRISIENYLDL